MDCTTFIYESFDSLRKFSDAFNVLPFIPVVVGMVITHHSLLTSLWVNVSHFPLKIFLSPLTSDATATSGQMTLLSYLARQSVTVWEGRAQLKPIPRTGTEEMDPTLESDHGSNAGLNPQKLKQDQVGLMLSKKDQLEAVSSKTPTMPPLPWDPPRGDTLPPPPLPSLARTHNTPKGQNAHPSSSVPSLLAQFQQSQQSQLWNASRKGTLSKGTLVKDIPMKDTPKKDTPKKGEQMPGKKLLMPDKSTEPPPPLKSNGPAPPAVNEGAKLTMARQTKARRRRKERRKSLRVSPPWLLTQRQRRLKSSRKNSSG